MQKESLPKLAQRCNKGEKQTFLPANCPFHRTIFAESAKAFQVSVLDEEKQKTPNLSVLTVLQTTDGSNWNSMPITSCY